MIDLVQALRNRATWETATGITEPHQHIDWMAAEEITRLREENARLREEIERLKGERATDKTSNGCRVCGLQFTDSLGRLTAMGYSCRRDDCPSRVSC